VRVKSRFFWQLIRLCKTSRDNTFVPSAFTLSVGILPLSLVIQTLFSQTRHAVQAVLDSFFTSHHLKTPLSHSFSSVDFRFRALSPFYVGCFSADRRRRNKNLPYFLLFGSVYCSLHRICVILGINRVTSFFLHTQRIMCMHAKQR